MVSTLINTDNFCKNSRYFRRSVELYLTLSTFRRKVTHQIFVSITNDIIAFCFVFRKIKFRTLKNRNKLSKFINHFFVLTNFCLIIKMSNINNTLQAFVYFSKTSDYFIYPFTYVLLIFKCNEVIKRTSSSFLRVRIRVIRFIKNGQISVFLPFIFISYILHKQKCKYVIFIL